MDTTFVRGFGHPLDLRQSLRASATSQLTFPEHQLRALEWQIEIAPHPLPRHLPIPEFDIVIEQDVHEYSLNNVGGIEPPWAGVMSRQLRTQKDSLLIEISSAVATYHARGP